ncbi:MAG: hypothetical protein EG823_01960 [Actinobacteria bacterium]|nr:hypothetical protein [Actinomycetota bacterium]
MDAREAIEQWRDSIPQDERAEATAGVALVGAGLVFGAFAMLRGRRGLFAWALPGALIAAGIVMLSDVAWDTRTERIAETEELISAELASLDPVARAQVLKGVGERQVKSFIPGRG